MRNSGLRQIQLGNHRARGSCDFISYIHAKQIKISWLRSPSSRIARVIRQERGNALLVGVGGTGKQSLTRLAAHICGYRCFEIELSRGYNYDSFHEDLRRLYKMAGVEGKDMVFLFTDTQVGMNRLDWYKDSNYLQASRFSCPSKLLDVPLLFCRLWWKSF